MKKPALVSVLLLVLFCGCKKVEKDPHNYYPKVETTGVVLLPDGTVKVTGEIISEGNSPVIYAGFCMDTLSNPSMLCNQQNVESIDGNTFSCIYSALNKAHKYYFRAWVANENGYAIGKDVVIDSVTISPEIIPCSPAIDTFTISNSYGSKNEKYISISPITQSTLSWRVDLNTYYHDLELEFSQKPIGGVYTVWDNASSKNTVKIMVDNSTTPNGSKVYVRETTGNLVEITICGLDFYDGSVVSTIKTRFRATIQ